MRRKDLTTSEASTWCAKHQGKEGSMTGQSKRACLCREVPTDHEHRASAVVAAASEEQECRDLLEKRRWKSTPEADADHARHARVHAQADHQRRTATYKKAGQSSRPRAAR